MYTTTYLNIVEGYYLSNRMVHAFYTYMAQTYNIGYNAKYSPYDPRMDPKGNVYCKWLYRTLLIQCQILFKLTFLNDSSNLQGW